MKGTISRLVPDRGFGFVRTVPGVPEYFFHRSDLVYQVEFDELRVEMAVTFEPIQSPKGPRATVVTIEAA